MVNVYDGIYSTEFSFGGSCFIQLTFPDSQVGVLDSVKILINGLSSSKSPYAGISLLQGFDGTNFVDLWRLDKSIGEGWNTKTWNGANKPAYRAYKWSGTSSGSCRFGEIVFTGILANPDTASSTACPVKLVVGTATTSLNSVSYDASVTPRVDLISPRYGKVSGN